MGDKDSIINELTKPAFSSSLFTFAFKMFAKGYTLKIVGLLVVTSFANAKIQNSEKAHKTILHSGQLAPYDYRKQLDNATGSYTPIPTENINGVKVIKWGLIEDQIYPSNIIDEKKLRKLIKESMSVISCVSNIIFEEYDELIPGSKKHPKPELLFQMDSTKFKDGTYKKKWDPEEKPVFSDVKTYENSLNSAIMIRLSEKNLEKSGGKILFKNTYKNKIKKSKSKAVTLDKVDLRFPIFQEIVNSLKIRADTSVNHDYMVRGDASLHAQYEDLECKAPNHEACTFYFYTKHNTKLFGQFIENGKLKIEKCLAHRMNVTGMDSFYLKQIAGKLGSVDDSWVQGTPEGKNSKEKCMNKLDDSDKLPECYIVSDGQCEQRSCGCGLDLYEHCHYQKKDEKPEDTTTKIPKTGDMATELPSYDKEETINCKNRDKSYVEKMNEKNVVPENAFKFKNPSGLFCHVRLNIPCMESWSGCNDNDIFWKLFVNNQQVETQGCGGRSTVQEVTKVMTGKFTDEPEDSLNWYFSIKYNEGIRGFHGENGHFRFNIMEKDSTKWSDDDLGDVAFKFKKVVKDVAIKLKDDYENQEGHFHMECKDDYTAMEDMN